MNTSDLLFEMADESAREAKVMYDRARASWFPPLKLWCWWKGRRLKERSIRFGIRSIELELKKIRNPQQTEK